MVTSLRQPLIPALALLAVALIWLPLAPASALSFRALTTPDAWRLLLNDNQIPQALVASLCATLIAIGGALMIALLTIGTLWPGRHWQRLVARLPGLLAIPHLAFASAMVALFTDGGWLYRLWHDYMAPQDRLGLGLGLVLAVKEGAFFIWVLGGLLTRRQLYEPMLTARTLGYSPWQALMQTGLRVIIPALGPLLLATTAWSLSVVDVALLVGPGNPPTLAVLAWQWLNDPDPLRQQTGLLVALVILLLVAIFAITGWLLWYGFRRLFPLLSGRRCRDRLHPVGQFMYYGLGGVSGLTLIILLITALIPLAAIDWQLDPSRWQWLNWHTVPTTLGLALFSALTGLIICLLWLEGGLERLTWLLWIPLVFPAVPLVAGQYQLLLWVGLDGQGLGVAWSHLLWVIPWMLLVLSPAWARLDPRQIMIARTLGWGRQRRFWLLKLPLLSRPLLTALAVGFSVSVAQYLPTLYNGAGRIVTVTTEAVSLGSGGDIQGQATLALFQALLPLCCFGLTTLISAAIGQRRQGLH